MAPIRNQPIRFVILAQAGIQRHWGFEATMKALDSRLRGNDNRSRLWRPNQSRSSELRTLPGSLSMRASRPAAWPALSVLQVCLESSQPAMPGFVLPGILYPANPFVASEKSNVFPSLQCRLVICKDAAQVLWKCVNKAGGDFFSGHDQYRLDRIVGNRRASGIAAAAAGWCSPIPVTRKENTADSQHPSSANRAAY